MRLGAILITVSSALAWQPCRGGARVGGSAFFGIFGRKAFGLFLLYLVLGGGAMVYHAAVHAAPAPFMAPTRGADGVEEAVLKRDHRLADGGGGKKGGVSPSAEPPPPPSVGPETGGVWGGPMVCPPKAGAGGGVSKNRRYAGAARAQCAP